MNKQRVAVLGASNKPDRYAHKAQVMLAKHGHELVLINPGLSEIDGQPVVKALSDVEGTIDTLTIYVGPDISTNMVPAILALKPGRVIFNPRTIHADVTAALAEAGIPWVDGCTLVLLRSGQF
jgi:uncharacterized protein